MGGRLSLIGRPEFELAPGCAFICPAVSPVEIGKGCPGGGPVVSGLKSGALAFRFLPGCGLLAEGVSLAMCAGRQLLQCWTSNLGSPLA